MILELVPRSELTAVKLTTFEYILNGKSIDPDGSMTFERLVLLSARVPDAQERIHNWAGLFQLPFTVFSLLNITFR